MSAQSFLIDSGARNRHPVSASRIMARSLKESPAAKTAMFSDLKAFTASRLPFGCRRL